MAEKGIRTVKIVRLLHLRGEVSVAIVLAVVLAACGGRGGARLEQIAAFDTAGWAHDVALEDNKLYVSDRQGGYLIFDRARGWSQPAIFAPVKDVISLAPNGGAPLLASRFEGLVLVSATGRVTARFANGDIANSVVIRGDLAFAAYGLHGLVVARLAGDQIRPVAELPSSGWSHDVKTWGDRALMADWNGGLRVVDIRIPSDPAEIAVLPTPATTIAVALGESGGKPMAALADGHAGVAIVGLDDLGRPSLVTRLPLGLNPADSPHPERGGWVHSVAWSGRYIFAANWKRGLVVIDTKDIRNPKVLLEQPAPGTALGIAAEAQPDGSYLVFLADGEEGLLVFRFRS